jgi:hypothetical protein
VPGGVGPLTIAMLMSNTVKAARLRRGVREKGAHEQGGHAGPPLRPESPVAAAKG